MKRLFQHKPPQLSPDFQRLWQLWGESRVGQVITEVESRIISDHLSDKPGNFLVQASPDPLYQLHEQSPIAHKYCLTPDFEQGLDKGMHGVVDRLPLQTESIDALVLHHALEYSEKPHKALREAHRVLLPEGLIVIAGFNPISPMILRKAWPKRPVPWSLPFFSAQRIADWLRLLNFKIQDVRYGAYGFPIRYNRFFSADKSWEHWLQGHNLPFGTIYVIAAQKKTVGMTPIFEKRRLRTVIPLRRPEPTAKQPQQVLKQPNEHSI